MNNFKFKPGEKIIGESGPLYAGRIVAQVIRTSGEYYQIFWADLRVFRLHSKAVIETYYRAAICSPRNPYTNCRCTQLILPEEEETNAKHQEKKTAKKAKPRNARKSNKCKALKSGASNRARKSSSLRTR